MCNTVVETLAMSELDQHSQIVIASISFKICKTGQRMKSQLMTRCTEPSVCSSLHISPKKPHHIPPTLEHQ
jgi:hypothetical protein